MCSKDTHVQICSLPNSKERQPAADLAVGMSLGLYAYRLPKHENRDAIIRSAEEMLMRVCRSSDAPRPTAFSVPHGYRYQSAAIISEGDDDGVRFENEPSGNSGTRAPMSGLSTRASKFRRSISMDETSSCSLAPMVETGTKPLPV